jgi:hypothetical protein
MVKVIIMTNGFVVAKEVVKVDEISRIEKAGFQLTIVK